MNLIRVWNPFLGKERFVRFWSHCALWIALSWLFAPVLGEAQSRVADVESRLDSLKSYVTSHPEDPQILATLREITQTYFTGIYQMDSAAKYARILGEAGIRFDDERSNALSAYFLGRVADAKGEYARAIRLTGQFLNTPAILSDTIQLANGYYSMANIYIHQGDLEQAMEYQLRVLRIDEASGDKRNIGLSLNNMGIIMKELGREQEAIDYLERAQLLFEEIDDTSNVAMALSNLGGLYASRGDKQKALDTYRRSLSIYESEKHARGIALAHQHIGKVEGELGNTEQGLQSLHTALAMLLGLDLRKEVAETYEELALLHRSAGVLDSAGQYFRMFLEIAEDVGDRKAVRDAYRDLSELEAAKSNYAEAYENFRKYHAVNDSMLNAFIAARINQLESNYALERSEAEIVNLKAQQELNERLSTTLRWALISTGILATMAVVFLFYRMHSHRKLLQVEQEQGREAARAYRELKKTQNQLIHSEKMASLGELTAGIAHEIQNPLNFVNNFAAVNAELIDELEEEMDRGDLEEAKVIAKGIRENERKIFQHGSRAEGIVRSMLQHSLGSDSQKEQTDINELIEEHIRLAYHGFRAKNNFCEVELQRYLGSDLPPVDVVPQEIGRVVLNLMLNAFSAVAEKERLHDNGFQPTVEVSSTFVSKGAITLGADREQGHIEISIKDNGTGIRDAIKDKVFQPFFTTKPTGTGTGLGLSLSYDIITKGHQGSLEMKSEEGKGAEFVVSLPVR